jgi:hypothetical protein
VAVARTFHGPWTVLGNPHPHDASGTSYRSQISSVFRHPHKKDLCIALADRWLPHLAPEVDEPIQEEMRRCGQQGFQSASRAVRVVPGAVTDERVDQMSSAGS